MSYHIAAIDIHKKVLIVVVAAVAEEVGMPREQRWSWKAGSLEAGPGSGIIW
jgi:hypothetical protein